MTAGLELHVPDKQLVKLDEQTIPTKPQLLKSISVFTHVPDNVGLNPELQVTVATNYIRYTSTKKKTKRLRLNITC